MYWQYIIYAANRIAVWMLSSIIAGITVGLAVVVVDKSDPTLCISLGVALGAFVGFLVGAFSSIW